LLEAMQKGGGDEVLQNSVIKLFPDDQEIKELEDVCELLTELKTKSLYSYCGEDACKSVDATLELLMNMRRGNTPAVDALRCDPFMSRVVDKLPRLCVVRVAPEKKASQKAIFGKEAFSHMVAAAAKRIDQMTFECTIPLHAFKWLGTEAEKAEVARIAKEVVSSVGKRKPSDIKPSKGAPQKKQKAKGSASSSTTPADHGGMSAELAKLFA